MDLQMKRHKWFPTDDGVDVCRECAQPDLPEAGIFCPGKKPAVEPVPPGPYVPPRLGAPKPATPELPVWKIAPSLQALLDLAEMERKARLEVCGSITDLMRVVSAPEPSPLDRALEDFVARRKAKREAATMPMTFEEAGHVWGFNTDACVNCGYTVQALVATQHLPLCADQRGINAQAKVFSRAMSTPLPHDPDIHTRLMPWKGKDDE